MQATTGMLGQLYYTHTYRHPKHVQMVTTHRSIHTHAHTLTHTDMFVCDVMQGAVEINGRACYVLTQRQLKENG